MVLLCKYYLRLSLAGHKPGISPVVCLATSEIMNELPILTSVGYCRNMNVIADSVGATMARMEWANLIVLGELANKGMETLWW